MFYSKNMSTHKITLKTLLFFSNFFVCISCFFYVSHRLSFPFQGSRSKALEWFQAILDIIFYLDQKKWNKQFVVYGQNQKRLPELVSRRERSIGNNIFHTQVIGNRNLFLLESVRNLHKKICCFILKAFQKIHHSGRSGLIFRRTNRQTDRESEFRVATLLKY